MHSLLDAVTNIGRGLELAQVLQSIVAAAVALTDAQYGALGVIGDGHRLSQLLPVGMADDLAARIGQAACGRGLLGELIRHPTPLCTRTGAALQAFLARPTAHSSVCQ